MGKIRVGNKINEWLNRQWESHGGKYGKKLAASKRRLLDKKILNSELIILPELEIPQDDEDYWDYNPNCGCASCIDIWIKKNPDVCPDCCGTGIKVDHKGSTAVTTICDKCNNYGISDK